MKFAHHRTTTWTFPLLPSSSSSSSSSPWRPGQLCVHTPAWWGWPRIHLSAAASTPDACLSFGRWVFCSLPRLLPEREMVTGGWAELLNDNHHHNIIYTLIIFYQSWKKMLFPALISNSADDIGFCFPVLTMSLLILSFSILSVSFFCSRSVLVCQLTTALVTFRTLADIERWYSLKSLACWRILLRYSWEDETSYKLLKYLKKSLRMQIVRLHKP